jgi:hypothetical protein
MVDEVKEKPDLEVDTVGAAASQEVRASVE